MPGSTPRASRTTLIRFCSTARDHAASSNESSRPSGGAPSLLTSTSTRPKRPSAVSTIRAQSSARRMSAAIAQVSLPVSSAICRAAASSGSCLRATIATRAPSAASRRAIA